MPQFQYRGRDKEGNLRLGQRYAADIDILNTDLLKEGISVIHVSITDERNSYFDKIRDWLQGESLYLEELAIFARQMQLLHQANVPIVVAIRQLASHTHSHRLAHTLRSLIERIEKGESLATAMQNYPRVFSPLIVNIVQIGENTGHLSDAFGHIHQYLAFESQTIKQIKTSFRYPLFVFVSILLSFIITNIFVIPTFAGFYSNLQVALPWQTRLLIGTSHFFIHDGIYFLMFVGVMTGIATKYLRTPTGKYRWNKFELHIPTIGTLIKRIILIRFCQSFAIVLNSGISVIQGLILTKQTITNSYIVEQISMMQEAIERGVPLTKAAEKVDLFSPLEIQILSVGEKNGELGPALVYIANFHQHEIEFDLKRMSDLVGPVLIGAVSILILILALGIYLPIWNMINTTHG